MEVVGRVVDGSQRHLKARPWEAPAVGVEGEVGSKLTSGSLHRGLVAVPHLTRYEKWQFGVEEAGFSL